jgi:hypothetical protein
MAPGNAPPYRIEFANPARKQFAKLDRQVQESLAPKIDALAEVK